LSQTSQWLLAPANIQRSKSKGERRMSQGPDFFSKPEERAAFVTKLRKFRETLPADERKLFNALLGGAVATARFSKARGKSDSPGEALAKKLVTFGEDLPYQQRDALNLTMAAGAFAWGVAPDHTPDGDPQPVFITLELMIIIAIVGAGILAVVGLIEEDPEPDVPVLDLPDPQ
jgi:hypothetical protein